MIFRAPIGHWLLHKDDYRELAEKLKKGEITDVIQYMEFVINEIERTDVIRKEYYAKQMMEDGD